jgi:hypothetical protein
MAQPYRPPRPVVVVEDGRQDPFGVPGSTVNRAAAMSPVLRMLLAAGR